MNDLQKHLELKWAGRQVFLTGGNGFWGKNMTELLKSMGVSVFAPTSKELDLTSDTLTEFFFKIDKNKYDYIFHGAAVQGAGTYPLFHSAEQFDLNMRIHTNLLRAWHRYQPQAKLVGIESTCSYPGTLELLAESDYWTGPMHESVDFYGLTKKALHMGLEAYKKQYGLKGTCVTFATLYGPHDSFDPDKSHVVSALIRKFVEAKLAKEKEVEVWGDGTASREVIYVEDQCLGMLLAADNDTPDGLINIGSGVATSIKDLAETIKKVTEFEGKIVYNTNRFVGVKHKLLDISRAKERLGWTTKFPLRSLVKGIQQSVDWYINNGRS